MILFWRKRAQLQYFSYRSTLGQVFFKKMLWYFFLWLSAAACFVDKMIHVLAYILTFEIQHNRTAGSYNVSSSPFFDKRNDVFFCGRGRRSQFSRYMYLMLRSIRSWILQVLHKVLEVNWHKAPFLVCVKEYITGRF